MPCNASRYTKSFGHLLAYHFFNLFCARFTKTYEIRQYVFIRREKNLNSIKLSVNLYPPSFTRFATTNYHPIIMSNTEKEHGSTPVKGPMIEVLAPYNKQMTYTNPNTVAHFLDKYSQVCMVNPFSFASEY